MSAGTINNTTTTTPPGRDGLTQWRRRVKLQIGPPGGAGREWVNDDDGGALKINFSIEKTAKGKPNKGKITVYNLNADSRGFVEPEKENPRSVILFAGYEDDPPLIFAGDIDEAPTKRSGLDLITTIEGRDGGATWQTAKMVESFAGGGGQTTHDLMRRAASSLGLPIEIGQDVPAPEILRGFVAVGRASDIMAELASWSSADWSIQDGLIVVTASGEPRAGEIYELSPATGLLEATKDKKATTIKILLNGRILPKDVVRVEGANVSGLFVVDKIVHSGDSGKDASFFSTITASAKK